MRCDTRAPIDLGMGGEMRRIEDGFVFEARQENREILKDVVCVYCIPFFRGRKMRIEKAARALNPLLQHYTQL